MVGYTTREIMLLEFSSSIMCLILSGKVGSNIASEIGTMRVTQQIDALEIMGVNSAGYLILPKIIALMTMIPFLVIFSISSGIIGAFCTCWFGGVMNAEDLAYGLQYYRVFLLMPEATGWEEEKDIMTNYCLFFIPII